MSAFFAVSAAGIPSPGVMVFGMMPYIAAWSIDKDASLHDFNAAVALELFDQAFYTSPEACLTALLADTSLVLVSNKGRLCRLIDGKAHVYTPKIARGMHYARVNLPTDHGSATIRLHRVVAESFLWMFHLPGYIVDHMDRNNVNNWLSNLRWTTASENQFNRGFAPAKERAVMCCKLCSMLAQSLRSPACL